MPGGIEGLDNLGEPLEPIRFAGEASDHLRSLSALEGIEPNEVVIRALTLYDAHLESLRQGYEGPLYSKVKTESTQLTGLRYSILKIFGITKTASRKTTELYRIDMHFENPEDDSGQ